MIDLHSHILPDVDDGPVAWDGALEMLALAEAGGTQRIVATPHTLSGWRAGEAPRCLIPQLVAEANARAREAGLGVEVLAGNECMIDPDLEQQLRDGELLTLGGSRTVLLELPFSTWPPAVESTIFALQLAGYRVLLAHPERYSAVLDEPNRLLPLAERGVMMQLTSSSLTGRFNKRVQGLAQQLIGHGMATVVASDAHSPGGRNPDMRSARVQVAEWFDERTARWLFEDNPRAILADEATRQDEPQAIKPKRRFLGLF